MSWPWDVLVWWGCGATRALGCSLGLFMTCLGTCLCLLETAESKIPQTRWTEPLDPVRQELIFNCFQSLKDSRQNPFSGPFPKRPSLFPCPSPQPKTSWISPLILENAAYCSCCFCRVFSALSTLKELKRGLRGDHSSLYSESRAFYGTSSNEMKWWLWNKSKSELKLEKKKKLHATLPSPFKRHKSPSVFLICSQVMLFTHAHTDSVIINQLRACVKEVPYSSSWGRKRNHAKAPCLWAFPHMPTSR